MKVQVNWLKKYLEIDSPADELGHVLTMAGLEIESHQRLDDEKGRYYSPEFLEQALKLLPELRNL